MPFNSVNDYADYRDEGAWWQSTYIRTTTPTPGVALRYLDLSVGPGQPSYNPYSGTPLSATILTYNNNNSIYTGPGIPANQTKHLHSLTVDTTSSTAVPSTYLLCDHLLHYPYIDLSDTGEQTVDNTNTLPRYSDGDGVMCFVVVLAPTVAAGTNASCTVKYTNSEGVTGRTTTFALLGSTVVGTLLNASGNNAAVITTQCSFFIPLADGDKGIRKIESVTMAAGIGGFATFVLTNPIATIPLLTNVTQTEKTFFSRSGRAPKIENGAFLNFLECNGSTGTTAIFRSSLNFVWG